MAHPLEALLVLQDNDRKISKLQREIRDIPVRRSEIEAQLDNAKARLAAARERQMQVQSDIKQLEIEVEAHKEKVVRYKNQQMEAKTNDQYRALLSEAAAEEKNITELEDREIVLMEKLEVSNKEIAACEAELSEEEEEIREEQEMLVERLEETEEYLESVVAKRERMIVDVEPSLLMKYNRIFKNKGDFAVVRVENGHCRGCNMKLPPQVVNDAINPAKLVACNYCGRMLVNI